MTPTEAQIKKAEEEFEKMIPVWNFETYYRITDDGRLYSIFKKDFLKPRINHKGYLIYSLWYRDTKKTFGTSAHRLLLQSFTKSSGKGMVAAHKNGIRQDNRLSNLYWATHKQNSEDMIRHGNSPWGERSGASKLKKEDVLFIRKNYKIYGPNASNVNELAKRFGVSRHTITRTAAGGRWQRLENEE